MAVDKPTFDSTIIAIEFAAITISAIAFFGAAVQTGFLRRFFGSIPIAHKIAVIGLPGAGKTSLITAMFEVIQTGQAKPGIRIHGAKTIALVNRYIARLASGQVVGPTSENDVFVFRFSYAKKRLLQRFLYDVEIADFPGEYTEQMENKRSGSKKKMLDDSVAAEALLNREFFSWIASSTEYLFVVDTASIYSAPFSKIALEDIAARIRTSWQIIEDTVSDHGIGDPRGRHVHLVFSKVDSLIPALGSKHDFDSVLQAAAGNAENASSTKFSATDIKRRIREGGARQDLSERVSFSPEMMNVLRESIEHHFSDLIKFFESRTKVLNVHYTSLRARNEENQRLGVPSLIGSVLP